MYCHLIADDPGCMRALTAIRISRVNAARRAFMEEWQEYTMNDQVQWSIALCPCREQKVFPELDADAAAGSAVEMIFDVCRVTGGDQ